MDPIDILGSLLGRKAGGSGAGADILKEILMGGSRGEAPSRTAPTSRSAPASREPTADDINRQARELEDLLNVANSRSSRPATTQTQPPKTQAPQPTQSPRQQPAPAPPGKGGWAQEAPVNRRQDAPQDDESRQTEQAMILVRAMVNAAKCDGQISQAEQQSILGQLVNPSPEAIQFLREEFAKPLDVREFAWSVPVGMEQHVYTMSLIAIDLDSDREERYLNDLAHGLRLAPEVCDQIKGRLTGAGSRFATSR